MKIKYYGHACFSITCDNYTIVIDPYTNVNGYDELEIEANEVICSHSHLDHAYVDAVKINKNDNNPFTNTKINVYHDDTNGSKRGLNDINVLCAQGKIVVHMGDLGHMLDDDIINKIYECDVLMIPVGGYFTIDYSVAIELIKKINPKHIIPMHYRDGDKGYDVLDTIDTFLDNAKEYQDKMLLVRGYGKEIEL